MKERVHRGDPFRESVLVKSDRVSAVEVHSGACVSRRLCRYAARETPVTAQRYSYTDEGPRQRWADEIRWKHETLVLDRMGVFLFS